VAPICCRRLRAELRDDGIGFDPDAFSRQNEGDCRGIANMRARAERLGARLTIEPAARGGTVLSLELPLTVGGRMIMLPSRNG
jgi:signal transduction histidine kinase